MNLLDFDASVWEKIVDEAQENELETIDFKLFGYDHDKRVIQLAKENAKNAGVGQFLDLKVSPIAVSAPPVTKGTIVCNPPYGARIGDEDNLKDVYRDLGFTLKNRFQGWDAWIMSGNKELLQEMKLKATRKYFIYNGNIECRLLKYEMYSGTRKQVDTDQVQPVLN